MDLGNLLKDVRVGEWQNGMSATISRLSYHTVPYMPPLQIVVQNNFGTADINVFVDKICIGVKFSGNNGTPDMSFVWREKELDFVNPIWATDLIVALVKAAINAALSQTASYNFHNRGSSLQVIKFRTVPTNNYQINNIPNDYEFSASLKGRFVNDNLPKGF